MCAGTVRTKGNACAIEQDINRPLNVAKSGMMLMRVAGSKATHVDLRVRRDMVRQMIRFHLQSGTPEYPQGVDEKYLNSLPEDGVPDDLLIIEVDSEKDINAFAQGPPLLGKPDGGGDRLRYVGRPVKERVQEQVIRNAILEKTLLQTILNWATHPTTNGIRHGWGACVSRTCFPGVVETRGIPIVNKKSP